MKQKIIILILIIPIILIFTTSVVVKKTEILVKPVINGVYIDGKYNRTIDLAKGSENADDLIIKPIIKPDNIDANVKYTALEVKGKENADITVTDDGVVIPKSAGYASVKVSVMDRSATVDFYFYFSELSVIKDGDADPEVIEFTEQEITIGVGETVRLGTYLPEDEELQKKYTSINRDYILNHSSFKVEDKSVLNIEDEFVWKVKGLKTGKSYVYATYHYILLDHDGNISREEKTIKLLINVI